MIGIFFYYCLFFLLFVFEILMCFMFLWKSGIGLLLNGVYWRGMVWVLRVCCYSGLFFNLIWFWKFFIFLNKYFVIVVIFFCMKILCLVFRKLIWLVFNFFFCLMLWILIMRRWKGLVIRIFFVFCFINSFVYFFLGELKGVKIGRVFVVLF